MTITPLPSPLPCVPSCYSREIACMSYVQNFPQVSFPRVHLGRTGVHATYQTQYNTRRAFCGQFVYRCFCFRRWHGPVRGHTSHMLIHYYLWWIFTLSSVSISCEISRDRYWDIPKYHRHWYLSHPTVGVALFGLITFQRLSSSREELPISLIILLVQ